MRHVGLVDHKADINFGCALGDHVDIHIGNGAEDAGNDARRVADVLAYQANNGLSAGIFHVCQLGQVSGDGGNGFVGINRK